MAEAADVIEASQLSTDPFDDDKLHEECGVFGVWGGTQASAMVALGLHALQHRGQEAAGILSFDGEEFHVHRAMGHVAGNFDRNDVIEALPGEAAIGHNRYATSGDTAMRNVQPLYADLAAGGSLGRAQDGRVEDGACQARLRRFDRRHPPRRRSPTATPSSPTRPTCRTSPAPPSDVPAAPPS